MQRIFRAKISNDRKRPLGDIPALAKLFKDAPPCFSRMLDLPRIGKLEIIAIPQSNDKLASLSLFVSQFTTYYVAPMHKAAEQVGGCDGEKPGS